MALARYQAFAQDEAGNVLASATVEVRREDLGTLVPLFSDRGGASPIANPFTGDSDGYFAFHISGGAYKITVTKDAVTRTYRYVGIGTASESDTVGTSGTDAGMRWLFDSSVSMADPGSGDVRFNNASFASITAVAISSNNAESGNPSASAWLDTWDDSLTGAHRGFIIAKDISTPSNFVVLEVTAALVDNTTWKQLTVAHVASSGSFTNATPLSIQFSRTGDQGGDPGLRWLFDTSTSMADPGSGDLRLNNATLSSVTALAISANCGETGNPSALNYILTWDDSTTPGHRGLLILKKTSAPQNYAIYAVTAAVVNNTTWVQATISHVSSSGSFASGDAISVQFFRTGDQGDMTKAVYDSNDDGIIAVAQGGSGASSASGARANFGVSYGKQTIIVPAGAMKPRITNGPSTGTLEMATNKNIVHTLDFDSATQEFAQFDIPMPKSWDEGTVTFIPVWSHPATATNFGVVWGMDAVAISNDDALDVAFGTEQTSTDTGGTTNDLYHGPESSAITISGSPAANDYVQFRIHRNPANGSDTMAVDARLHAVILLYTNDNTNDT